MRSILAIFTAVLVALTAASVAVAQSYRIQPGDTLTVNVLEDPSIDRSVLVLPDGGISLPLAGSVSAAGLTVSQLENRLEDRLASNFASRPNVFVAVGPLAEPPEMLEEEPEIISVFIVGEVNNPGTLQLEPGTNLLQALAAAGGPSRFAATKRIQLRRVDAAGQERLAQFNYQAVLVGAARPQLWYLRDGDVIVVPERRLFE